MYCYDTWKTSPDDSSELNAFLEDKMESDRKSLIESITYRLKDKNFPVDELATVIISAMYEQVDLAEKIADILGIGDLHNFQTYALKNDFDRYYDCYQKG